MTEAQNFLRPINNTSIVQRVIDRMTKAMIHKELRPGDKIPTESELAESFGVGRNSVREAIKILVSYGVLEIRRPEGTFVTSGFSNVMIDPLLYGIILNDTESLESLKELREWVDIGVLHLAIKRADKNDIARLEEKFAEMKAAFKENDIEKIFETDNNFHSALDSAAHNDLFSKISSLIRTLTGDIRMRTIKSMSKLKKLKELENAHKKLLDAVKKNKPENSEELVTGSYFYKYDVLNEN